VGEQNAFLAKSNESLASAGDDFEHRRYNSCARNAYYAAFQAAVAALLHEGIRPARRWEHEFVRSQFAGILVYRRKRFGPGFRTLLTDAFDRRVDADYTDRSLKRQDAASVLVRVRQLVQEVQEQAGGNS
jgi:uncharacterized protein (UPF0332 family)